MIQECVCVREGRREGKERKEPRPNHGSTKVLVRVPVLGTEIGTEVGHWY